MEKQKVTHRPKGSMCMNCTSFRWNFTGAKPCPKPDEFPIMLPLSKDPDGVIVVKCSSFSRNENLFIE